MFSNYITKLRKRKNGSCFQVGSRFHQKYAFDENEEHIFALPGMENQSTSPGVFFETFIVIGLAHYAKASEVMRKFRFSAVTYWKVIDLLQKPELLAESVCTENYSVKTHAIPMIMVSTTQQLREGVRRADRRDYQSAFR